MGALLPSNVAFAADVLSTAVLKSARSKAKNTPASAPSRADGRDKNDLLPRHSQHGRRMIVATSTR